jgi:hypothetical protein
LAGELICSIGTPMQRRTVLCAPSQPARWAASITCRVPVPASSTVATARSGSSRRSVKVQPSRRSISGWARAASRSSPDSSAPGSIRYGSTGALPSVLIAYARRSWLTDGTWDTRTGG